MAEFTISPLAVRPDFDADRFLATSHAGELSAEDLAALAPLWDRWRDALNAKRIDNGTGSWLLLWMDEAVERRVERTWEDSPRQGFLEHALAVDCLMAAAAALVPEVAEHGCAPVPDPSPAVREAAASLGLAFPEPHVLGRRYALLTALPWRGGCATCHLSGNCPGPDGGHLP